LSHGHIEEGFCLFVILTLYIILFGFLEKTLEITDITFEEFHVLGCPILSLSMFLSQNLEFILYSNQILSKLTPNIGDQLMRKTFITTLALLTSISTFAASTNYDQLKMNDDGTSTIIGPKFKVATGSQSNLSARSNMNGVCKLYGYDFMIGNSAVKTGDDRSKTTVIGSNGRFSSTYSYNNSTSNNYIS
jgi:hypothetical protein